LSGPVTGWLSIAAFCGRLQSGRELHESGFTAAGRANDGNELALPGLQRDIFDREFGRLVVGEVDVFKIDERVGGHGAFRKNALLQKKRAGLMKMNYLGQTFSSALDGSKELFQMVFGSIRVLVPYASETCDDISARRAGETAP
jgi:hypothetical protein